MIRNRTILVLAVALAMSAFSGQVTAGLVMHYNLDQLTGTTAPDASGNGNTGTLSGGVSFDTDSVAGQFDKALDFNGTSDYIAVSDGGNLPSPGDSFTVAHWVKTTDGEGNHVNYNLNSLQFSIGNTGVGGGTFTVGIDSNVSSLDRAVYTDTVSNGSFNHIAVVFESDQVSAVYFNGNPQTATANDNHWLFNDAGNFSLMARRQPGTEFPVVGVLDDFAIFDTALSEQDVNDVMDLGVAGFIPEPSSVCLMTLGLLGLIGFGRRRNR